LVAENLPLGALAALLQRLDVYVGNDSGVTHLGAAVGVSTVALFGPSAVSQWAPRGPRVSIISQNVECSPCSRSAMKSCQHRMCLSRIDVPEVITRIRGFVSVPNLTRVNAATRV
jgi:ADP-heptose:LPS heptosyltransferase